MKTTERTSRKIAAKELNDIYNSYEVRKNSILTTYRKIFYSNEFKSWRLIGYAHDYSF